MQGNGILLFITGATVLWIIGRGYGKNIGSAWNTLIGASSSATSPAIPQFPPNPLNVQAPGTSMQIPLQQLGYQPPAIPYMGGSIA